jgi:hypothetical protein
MRPVPAQINTTWIGTLTDDDLIIVEARLHEQYAVIERREKRAQGAKYHLFRSPADLMTAWDRWSRVNAATRSRSLNPKRPR